MKQRGEEGYRDRGAEGRKGRGRGLWGGKRVEGGWERALDLSGRYQLTDWTAMVSAPL